MVERDDDPLALPRVVSRRGLAQGGKGRCSVIDEQEILRAKNLAGGEERAAEDDVADQWLALMRDAEHARSQGNDELYETLLAAAAEWDEGAES